MIVSMVGSGIILKLGLFGTSTSFRSAIPLPPSSSSLPDCLVEDSRLWWYRVTSSARSQRVLAFVLLVARVRKSQRTDFADRGGV